jgi:hypothetical protein
VLTREDICEEPPSPLIMSNKSFRGMGNKLASIMGNNKPLSFDHG